MSRRPCTILYQVLILVQVQLLALAITVLGVLVQVLILIYVKYLYVYLYSKDTCTVPGTGTCRVTLFIPVQQKYSTNINQVLEHFTFANTNRASHHIKSHLDK